MTSSNRPVTGPCHCLKEQKIHGILDLADIGIFVAEFTGGCP